MSRAKFALGVPLALAADMVFFSMLRRARPRPVGLTVVPRVGRTLHVDPVHQLRRRWGQRLVIFAPR